MTLPHRLVREPKGSKAAALGDEALIAGTVQ